MPANHPIRTSSRQRLLDAAAALIAAHGVQELTLEAVASAASMTKSGLIYHFKTKDDLLTAVVERMVDQFDQRNRTRAAGHGDTTRALLLASIDSTFDMSVSERRLLSNLLAAASAHPHLLEPAQSMFARANSEFSASGPNAGLALVLSAALDGFMLLELSNLHAFSKSQRTAMRQALRELVLTLS